MRNELHKPPYTKLPAEQQALVQQLARNPDLSNPTENHQRKQALWWRRAPLLDRLPSDVTWYKGRLEDGDLLDLRAPARCGWDELCPGGVLRNLRSDMAERFRDFEDYVKREDFEPELIMISVRTSGPYTLIDGTNRAAAMLLAYRDVGTTYAGGRAYVGLSPQMNRCLWYNP